MVNPACSHNWEYHRSVAAWISDFLTRVKANMQAFAADERKREGGLDPDATPEGDPYMEVTIPEGPDDTPHP